MKLAVCARGEGIEAQVDQRFGRCACFVIVDTESGEEVESLRNENAGAVGGAGPQSAQLLSRRDVKAVALGNVGPNASLALKASGIKVYTGVEGTVGETLQKYREGKLKILSEPNVSPHAGLKD